MPVRTKDNFLVFGSPLIGQEEIDEVVASMKSGWLGTGPKVARFEKDFSAYLGKGYAAACNSCTAALHLSLVALDLKPGDEVITTPLTFCASVNAIIHAGGTPVLADVDPNTMNIDPDRIREKITDRTRAILPVHFAGRICDMDGIMAIANEHDLKVVEDCAHAIETTYKGRHAGTFGDFGCFSFYVTKNVCTGEGGMVMAPHRGGHQNRQDSRSARHVRRRLETVLGRWVQALRGGARRVQVQHDGHPGRHRHPPTRTGRGKLRSPLRDLGYVSGGVPHPARTPARARGTGHPPRAASLYADARPRAQAASTATSS